MSLREEVIIIPPAGEENPPSGEEDNTLKGLRNASRVLHVLDYFSAAAYMLWNLNNPLPATLRAGLAAASNRIGRDVSPEWIAKQIEVFKHRSLGSKLRIMAGLALLPPVFVAAVTSEFQVTRWAAEQTFEQLARLLQLGAIPFSNEASLIVSGLLTLGDDFIDDLTRAYSSKLKTEGIEADIDKIDILINALLRHAPEGLFKLGSLAMGLTFADHFREVSKVVTDPRIWAYGGIGVLLAILTYGLYKVYTKHPEEIGEGVRRLFINTLVVILRTLGATKVVGETVLVDWRDLKEVLQAALQLDKNSRALPSEKAEGVEDDFSQMLSFQVNHGEDRYTLHVPKRVIDQIFTSIRNTDISTHDRRQFYKLLEEGALWNDLFSALNIDDKYITITMRGNNITDISISPEVLKEDNLDERIASAVRDLLFGGRQP